CRTLLGQEPFFWQLSFMVAFSEHIGSFASLKDEVQIFDEALTDAQVYALYKSRTGSIIDYDEAGNMLSDADGSLYTYDGACPGMFEAGKNRIVHISKGDG
ncbi:MAG: hypothetical protein KAS23_07070, partial [Anaerohalosphaera sp.]|nr:hypothetical protein [Anaerohalosphaera sp.]